MASERLPTAALHNSSPLPQRGERRFRIVSNGSADRNGKSKKSSPLSTLYFLFVVAVGFAAAVRMAGHPGEPNWESFAVLLVMACATSAMRVNLPGVSRSVSLSFFFLFAAIIDQPAGVALYIACVAHVFAFLVDYQEHKAWRHLVFDLGLATIALFVTSAVYGYLAEETELQWLLTTVAAALTYYVVSSAISALQIAIVEHVYPWKVWKQRLLWTGPVYMIAPFAVAMTRLLTDATTSMDGLLALAVIFAGYFYLKGYFASLHDRHDHVQKLAAARQRAIEVLAVAVEAKDGTTAHHLKRVKSYATRLARKQKPKCSESEIRTLELAALLHDIGKVGVPDYVLNKPGRLTEYEFRQVANHTTIGAEIVSAVAFAGPVDQIVASHHEHWDGSGYPRGLSGEKIPRLARILTVVDCFDALISDRPYRPALPISDAIEVMRQQRSKIFDPKILDSFLDELPKLTKEIKRDLAASKAAPAAHSARTVVQSWIEEEENKDLLRREILRALTHDPDRLALAYEVLDVLGADLDFDKSVTESLKILRQAIPFAKAGVFILRENEYVLSQAVGIPDHCLSRIGVSAQDGLLAQAAVTQKPLVANAPPSDVFPGPVSRYLEGVKSILVAPLFAGNRLAGSLALFADEAELFGQEQRLLVELVTRKYASTLLLSQAVQRVSLEAATDEVTDLPNARAAFRRLETELDRAQREGQTVGVLFMDLDGLKPVNDSYGHAAGDRLLQETARLLKRRFRSYDFIARVGGDEFLAIVTGITAESLKTLIETLKQGVARDPIAVADAASVDMTISIGSAMYPHDGTEPEELVYLSDQRMYQDKEKARSETAEIVRISRELVGEAV